MVITHWRVAAHSTRPWYSRCSSPSSCSHRAFCSSWRLNSRGKDPHLQRSDEVGYPSKCFGCWIDFSTSDGRIPPRFWGHTVRTSRCCALHPCHLKTCLPFSLRQHSSNWCGWWYPPWVVYDHRQVFWGPISWARTRKTFYLWCSFRESVLRKSQAVRQLHRILPLRFFPDHLRQVHFRSDFLWSAYQVNLE